MSTEDIYSPPYPGEGTSPSILHSMLDELRLWVLNYRASLGSRVGGTAIPCPKQIVPRDGFIVLPVLTQFRSLIFLRKLREAWDDIVRNYEGEWNSPSCIRRQALLVSMAARYLNRALEPFELREARSRDDLQDMYKHFDHIASALKTVWEPDHGKDPETED